MLGIFFLSTFKEKYFETSIELWHADSSWHDYAY